MEIQQVQFFKTSSYSWFLLRLNFIHEDEMTGKSKYSNHFCEGLNSV